MRPARHDLHVRPDLQPLHAIEPSGRNVHCARLQSQVQNGVFGGERGRHDKVLQHGDARACRVDERSREAHCELECASDDRRHGHIVLGRLGPTLGPQDFRVQAEVEHRCQEECRDL